MCSFVTYTSLAFSEPLNYSSLNFSELLTESFQYKTIFWFTQSGRKNLLTRRWFSCGMILQGTWNITRKSCSHFRLEWRSSSLGIVGPLQHLLHPHLFAKAQQDMRFETLLWSWSDSRLKDKLQSSEIRPPIPSIRSSTCHSCWSWHSTSNCLVANDLLLQAHTSSRTAGIPALQAFR